jgi:hypothetical protein
VFIPCRPDAAGKRESKDTLVDSTRSLGVKYGCFITEWHAAFVDLRYPPIPPDSVGMFDERV